MRGLRGATKVRDFGAPHTITVKNVPGVSDARSGGDGAFLRLTECVNHLSKKLFYLAIEQYYLIACIIT
jgi:hypothetical protein